MCVCRPVPAHTHTQHFHTPTRHAHAHIHTGVARRVASGGVHGAERLGPPAGERGCHSLSSSMMTSLALCYFVLRCVCYWRAAAATQQAPSARPAAGARGFALSRIASALLPSWRPHFLTPRLPPPRPPQSQLMQNNLSVAAALSIRHRGTATDGGDGSGESDKSDESDGSGEAGRAERGRELWLRPHPCVCVSFQRATHVPTAATSGLAWRRRSTMPLATSMMRALHSQVRTNRTVGSCTAESYCWIVSYCAVCSRCPSAVLLSRPGPPRFTCATGAQLDQWYEHGYGGFVGQRGRRPFVG